MLEVFVAAKVLPIRVLEEGGDDTIVALIERVLEVLKANHEPGGERRTAHTVDECAAEPLLEFLPVDAVGEADEVLLGINYIFEPAAKKFNLATVRILRMHFSPEKSSFERISGDFTLNDLL